MTDDFRALPHDIEAEQCVLGACLISPNAVAVALGHLGADDFYRPVHQEIFIAIADLRRRGEPIDVVSVRAELERIGKLDPAGKKALLLHDLSAVVPTAANAGFYVNRVRMLGSKRLAALEFSRLGEMAYEADTTPEDLVQAAEDSLSLLRRTGDDGDVSGLSTMGSFVDETDEDHDWLIPGVLERMDRVIVVASEGAGKTTWARQITVMGAAGLHPFSWGTRIPPFRTLYLDLENPPALIRRKARHLVSLGRNDAGWDDDRCWRWTMPGGIDLRKPNDQYLVDRVIEQVRPDFVAMGPLYKAFLESGEKAETINGQVARVLDGFRQRHGVALWLETHAPMEQSGQRSLRPLGSGVWQRWPEFGLALRKDPNNPMQVFVERFRGDRDERAWPHRLQRSSPWPWQAVWDGGFPVEEASA